MCDSNFIVVNKKTVQVFVRKNKRPFCSQLYVRQSINSYFSNCINDIEMFLLGKMRDIIS